MKKLIALIAIALLTVTACSQPQQPPPAEEATYEVTEDDVIGLLATENFTSWDVSVHGVELSDSQNDVLEEMGEPDNYTRFEGEDLVVENFEYGEEKGINESGLIFHLENGNVTRITVNDAYNKYLHNDTVINDSKRDIYFSLGPPDSKKIEYRFILFQYNEEGIEFITFRGDEVGFSLVPPGGTDRNYTTNVTSVKKIPYQEEIKLQ